jgi:hypothetical protein
MLTIGACDRLHIRVIAFFDGGGQAGQYQARCCLRRSVTRTAACPLSCGRRKPRRIGEGRHSVAQIGGEAVAAQSEVAPLRRDPTTRALLSLPESPAPGAHKSLNSLVPRIARPCGDHWSVRGAAAAVTPARE